MMIKEKIKRVVYVRWKEKDETEIFSNLKNLCISYPQFNYNTMNNYLSKQKKAYDNAEVRVERKNVINKPVPLMSPDTKIRNIAPVLKKVSMKADGDKNDLMYWLAQPAQKRAQAVTFLVSQMLNEQQRMDKTVISKFKLKK